MPRRCVALGCSTETGEGYSLHEFPMDDAQTCAKWTRAVQQKRRNWPGPTAGSSVLCEKHFTPECFVEGWRYGDTFSIRRKKLLKPGAIPTIFPKSIDDDNSTSLPPPKRPASERRRLKSVSDNR